MNNDYLRNWGIYSICSSRIGLGLDAKFMSDALTFGNFRIVQMATTQPNEVHWIIPINRLKCNWILRVEGPMNIECERYTMFELKFENFVERVCVSIYLPQSRNQIQCRYKTICHIQLICPQPNRLCCINPYLELDSWCSWNEY